MQTDRVTSNWSSATVANEGHIFADGSLVAFRSGDAQTYFAHQDWVNTDRLHTDSTGGSPATYTSLPFGDGGVGGSGYSAWDFDHFGAIDYNTESNTYHAQYRQYNQTQGRWMEPDPYSESYVFTNPQSFNRYTYVMNNPMSATDASGLMMDPCDDDCGGWGGGGGGGCSEIDGSCDPGGCDPIFDTCDLGDGSGSVPAGPPPPPRIIGYKNLNGILGESLGLPPGMLVPSGDLLSMFGVGSGTCEFGVCSAGPMGLVQGTGEDSCIGNLSTCLPIVDPQLLIPLIPMPQFVPHKEGALNRWPLNGNLFPGYKPQDGICSPPMPGSMNNNPAMLSCCQAHDNCYAAHECNSSSWLPAFPGVCKMCNVKVVACLAF